MRLSLGLLHCIYSCTCILVAPSYKLTIIVINHKSITLTVGYNSTLSVSYLQFFCLLSEVKTSSSAREQTGPNSI